jgi:hypothetical protein
VTGIANILVAPDYIGLGESHAQHPYMYAKATSSASIDFLRASQTLVRELQGGWPDDLFDGVFSRGPRDVCRAKGA